MIWKSLFLLAIMTAPLPQVGGSPRKVSISFAQAQELGSRIWQNECAGKVEGLTSWNKGEDFASLGIGHFIWYPSGREHTYKETFPDLLVFLKSCGVLLPKWLDPQKGCPWRSRRGFLVNLDSPKMVELREFLYDTKALQAVYIANRLELALPKMTARLELTEKRRVENHFYALVQTPKGLYALIDYLNFKGEGTNPSESYKGKGWGLLQVLQRMPANTIRPLDDFVKVAKEVLEERVKNAPAGKDERQWLKGWNARLNTYLQS